MINGTVRMLIRYAYEPGDTEISGLPQWAEDERFDVIAKAPVETSAADLRAMIRTVLQERFRLQTHMEHRDASIYALILPSSPGPRLRKTEANCDQMFDDVRRGKLALADVRKVHHGGLAGATGIETRLGRWCGALLHRG